MWRYDAQRSNSTPQVLENNLSLEWVYELPPLVPCWKDPVNQERMPFDSVYEPVVMGGSMFIVSNRSDRVLALSTKNGRTEWEFFTDGPIRFPAVAADGKVYFTSDDGFLYCLDASDGRMLWRVRGGIDGKVLLGNGRLISAWPARGGPVLYDKKIFFAASIWPFMGIFIKSVDAETGKLIWENSGNGQIFTLQPHSPPSFASLAPQGALAVSDGTLFVPNGRARPSYLDLKTGKLLFSNFAAGAHINQIVYFLNTFVVGFLLCL